MATLSKRIHTARQMIILIANTNDSMESKRIQAKELMTIAMGTERETIYGQLMIIRAQLQFCNEEDNNHLSNLAETIRG